MAALSEAVLRWRWRHSYLRLVRATAAAEVDLVVEMVALRQVYLDELERRDREGFAAWLASGARASGDPARFVGGQQRR